MWFAFNAGIVTDFASVQWVNGSDKAVANAQVQPSFARPVSFSSPYLVADVGGGISIVGRLVSRSVAVRRGVKTRAATAALIYIGSR